ncbi:MAG TPA: outer membrane beta-barrel protein [Rhizomicrobium sp.]|jgi:opacity protein-like surface antigen
MKCVKLLFVAGLVIASPALLQPAMAQSISGLYVTGDGGASFLPDLKLKDGGATANEQFNTGTAYGGAVGYDTGNGARFEIDSNYILNNLTHLGGSSTNGHLDSTSVMLNGQVDLLHHASVTPYAGVGIGYENVGINADGTAGHDWKPAYQAEAGLRTDINDKVSVFGEYRFTQSEAQEIADTHQHFADHGLLAGLTWHMGQ